MSTVPSSPRVSRGSALATQPSTRRRPAADRRGSLSSAHTSATPLPVLLPSLRGDVRVGPIVALPAVLRDLGAPVRAVFAEADVPLGMFEDPERRLSYPRLGRLLVIGARRTGCEHLGLLLGDRFTLAGFGPLGELMRNAPTVGEALRLLILHLYLHDRIAVPFLAPTGDASNVDLGYSIKELGAQATRFVYDAAIAIAHRILRELCGEDWRPTLVSLPHLPPPYRAAYQRVYQAPVQFDAAIAAVRFDARWLARPIAGSDPVRYATLSQALEAQRTAHPLRFTDEVLCALHRVVLTGKPSTARVAGLFAISERTLRKRLLAQNASLAQLLRETRQALAEQLLHNTRLSLSEVAGILGYADLASFSRAFRSWTDRSPSQWRETESARKRE